MENYALMSNQTLAKIKSNMIFKVAMYIRLSRALLLLMNMLMMDIQVRTLIDQHFKE